MSGDWTRAGDPLRSLRPSRRRIAREVDEELAFHLEMRRRELQGEGLSAAEAAGEALRRFGDFPTARAACVASDRRRVTRMRRRDYLEELRQDLRLGLRQLRRRPLFAAVAVATLGVAIGANTAIWSVADHVLLRPLPYAQAERVVTVWETDERTGERKLSPSPGDFLDWQARATTLAAWGLADPYGLDLTSVTPPEPVQVWRVTGGFFAALGVAPILGRTFSPAELAPGGPPVVLAAHGFWLRHLDGDPSAVGRTIELDGVPATVVGVLPAGLAYPERRDLWAPKVFSPEEERDRRSQFMYAVARLAPGATLGGAQAELAGIAAQLGREYPASNAASGVHLVPLPEQVLGAVRPALLALVGAVAFVLLIACANVASLLLARNAERGREQAVRSALGASRGRLVAQMLTESLLLGGLGGALGVGLAMLGVRLFALAPPAGLPRAESVAVDGRMLAFAGLVTLATALATGLVPALRAARPQIAGVLARGARSLAGSREAQRLRGALVAAEVALAVVPVIGAGLLGRSFAALLANDLGFATENRATIQVFLWDRNPTAEARRQRVAEFEAGFRSLPQVLDVGVGTALPFHPVRIDPASSLIRLDRPAPLPGEEQRVTTLVASPGYFRVLGIEVIAGRSFGEADRADAPPVALLNRTAARRAFGDEDPVGKRVRFGVMGRPLEREVVGVVADTRPVGFDSDPTPEVYVPFEQNGNGSLTFVIATSSDAAALLPSLRQRLWEVDPQQSVYHSATVGELVAASLGGRRFQLALLGALSAVALALAILGLYGLVSYSTEQRTGEIGLRMALGATAGRIAAMIVGEGLKLAVPGVALGVAGALGLTRLFASLLYGVAPHDPATFAQLAALVLAVAAAAAYLPARRVLRRDPLAALRAE